MIFRTTVLSTGCKLQWPSIWYLIYGDYIVSLTLFGPCSEVLGAWDGKLTWPIETEHPSGTPYMPDRE